jgi:hypothetical protein
MQSAIELQRAYAQALIVDRAALAAAQAVNDALGPHLELKRADRELSGVRLPEAEGEGAAAGSWNVGGDCLRRVGLRCDANGSPAPAYLRLGSSNLFVCAISIQNWARQSPLLLRLKRRTSQPGKGRSPGSSWCGGRAARRRRCGRQSAAGHHSRSLAGRSPSWPAGCSGFSRVIGGSRTTRSASPTRSSDPQRGSAFAGAGANRLLDAAS